MHGFACVGSFGILSDIWDIVWVCSVMELEKVMRQGVLVQRGVYVPELVQSPDYVRLSPV